MLIDIITLILLVVALFKGISKGLVVALFSFLGFIIGLAAALKLSGAMATYIGTNVAVAQRWLPFIAFLVVFIAVLLLVRLGAKLIEGALKLVLLGWLNRLGGVVFLGLIYFFIYSILLFYATQLGLIKPAAVQVSVTYGFIAPLAPKIMALLGAVIPFFGNLFTELLRFFDGAAPKAA